MVWPSGLHSTNPVEWEKNKGFEGKTLVKRHEPSICCTVFCGVQRVILQGDDSDSEEEDDFEEEEEYDVEDDEGFGQMDGCAAQSAQDVLDSEQEKFLAALREGRHVPPPIETEQLLAAMTTHREAGRALCAARRLPQALKAFSKGVAMVPWGAIEWPTNTNLAPRSNSAAEQVAGASAAGELRATSGEPADACARGGLSPINEDRDYEEEEEEMEAEAGDEEAAAAVRALLVDLLSDRAECKLTLAHCRGGRPELARAVACAAVTDTNMALELDPSHRASRVNHAQGLYILGMWGCAMRELEGLAAELAASPDREAECHQAGCFQDSAAAFQSVYALKETVQRAMASVPAPDAPGAAELAPRLYKVYKGAFLGEENEEYVEELLNESWDGFLVIADIVGAIMCSCQQSQDLTHAEADEATRQRAIRIAIQALRKCTQGMDVAAASDAERATELLRRATAIFSLETQHAVLVGAYPDLQRRTSLGADEDWESVATCLKMFTAAWPAPRVSKLLRVMGGGWSRDAREEVACALASERRAPREADLYARWKGYLTSERAALGAPRTPLWPDNDTRAVAFALKGNDMGLQDFLCVHAMATAHERRDVLNEIEVCNKGINVMYNVGAAFVHLCAYAGRWRTVQFLIERGCNVNAKDAGHFFGAVATPLDYVVHELRQDHPEYEALLKTKQYLESAGGIHYNRRTRKRAY